MTPGQSHDTSGQPRDPFGARIKRCCEVPKPRDEFVKWLASRAKEELMSVLEQDASRQSAARPRPGSVRRLVGAGIAAAMAATLLAAVLLWTWQAPDAWAQVVEAVRTKPWIHATGRAPQSGEPMEAALDDYMTDLDSFDARIQMRFSYPDKVKSLRSGLEGYQYYDIALELVEQNGVRQKIMHLDYVYSSTCPCSLELSEHARSTRGQLATPHSQRSVARISVVVDCDADCLWFEDLIELCRRAVPTETQVMVKQEDEQATARRAG